MKNEQSEEGCWMGGDGQIRKKEYFQCLRDEIRMNDQNEATTEHCLGNLVLLYKGDNSTFSDKSFNEKKEFFFDTNKKEYFNSRHLLHTIYLFARSEWKGKDIAENKQRIIDGFTKYYKQIKENYYDTK